MRVIGGRWLAVTACAALLTACSSVRPWLNTAMQADQVRSMHVNETRDPSLVMAVTISGGGARAAAFGYGVLRELEDHEFDWRGRRLTLLEATDLISAVSGGSIVAAYYAAFGRTGLPRFEHDFLRQDFQQSLLGMMARPGNLRDLSSPWFGRAHLLARRLDTLYEGKTFADLERNPRHPQLIVTATDLARGTGFEFTWDQFTLICSDLGRVPLSFAVAASSAVPLLLSPVTLRNYADRCPAEVQRLLDRALMNGGLRQTFREVVIPPGSVHKVVLVVVNAEREPTHDIDASDTVPGMFDVAETLLFGAGARKTRETQEYLQDVIREWRKDLEAHAAAGASVFAADADIHVIMVNLRDAALHSDRRQLLRVPTAFTVSDSEVTELITAGREVLRYSPDFQAPVRALGARGVFPSTRSVNMKEK